MTLARPSIMFDAEHNASSDAGAIEDHSSSFLYSTSDSLLGRQFLIPDPDPKFDSHSAKLQHVPFGVYDNLRLYERYSESGPSSVNLGDGNDVSEHSGSHIILGEEVIDDGPGRAEADHGQGRNHQPGYVQQHVNDSSISSQEFVMNGESKFGMESELISSSNPDGIQHYPNLRESTLNANRISARTPKTPEPLRRSIKASLVQTPLGSTKKPTGDFRARSSIPTRLSWMEFARQGILAAYSSRLNPYALHPGEYKLLRSHITRPQVTIYLNIRNAILRLWHRNPLVAVTQQEAAGCVRDGRYFGLSQVAYDWLLRNGYINFGCVDVPETTGPVRRGRSKGKRQQTIVIIGAGMSGLGCARHLEALASQYGEQFAEVGQKPPKIVLLEARNRVGGRVYSHPLRDQGIGSLPPGMRSTAEMGAMIVTGFEHGNPLNFIVRGQLALPYHSLKDNTVLYDYDGRPVDKDRDLMVERLWNDTLERAAVFRNKLPTVQTVEGDRSLIGYGEDPKDSSEEKFELLSSLEEAGISVTVTDGNAISVNAGAPDHSSAGVERLAGRQYQHAGSSAKSTAAEVARSLGWRLRDHVADHQTLDLLPVSKSSYYPTLGETIDEGIRQYQDMLVELTPQDLRLLNWHHANLEYANAANVNQLSLGGWDQDIGNEFEGEHAEIIGGYTQVPRGLWQLPTPLDVRFRCAVKQIRHQNTNSGRGASVVVECLNGEFIEADRVVLTSPLGILKEGSISFDPPLPHWKSACIERMGFGLLNKVVLVYDEPFWEEHSDIFGFLNKPEQGELDQRSYSSCRGRFYLFWNCIKTSGRPMLVALMAGAAAYQTEETDNGSLVREVTDRLAKAFAPSPIPSPSEVIVTRWKQDPYARGTFSFVGPRTQPGDYDVMAQSVGPLHFAGEATCGTHPATVHGAYLSGLRAASEVIEQLLGPIVIPESPLVPPKIKPEPAAPRTGGSKRKSGYIDVWEPIDKPDPFMASIAREREAEEYEARVGEAVRAEMGNRPVRPPGRQRQNPFLLFIKDEWYAFKTKCDEQRVAATGNAEAKASRDEIRAAVGQAWRSASEDVKAPYLEKCKSAREVTAEALAEHEIQVRKWDRGAARIRAEFVAKNPPPVALQNSPDSGRKSRKSGSYADS